MAQAKPIGYTSEEEGITYGAKCCVPYLSEKELAGFRPIFRIEFNVKAGDFITCTASCGKTIIGNSRYYGG
jgi:hypothetical protein